MGAALIVLSQSGLETAQKIKQSLPDCQIHALEGRANGDVSFTETAAHLQKLFTAGETIIGICSSGILIRLLAPVLADKTSEPAVLAIAEDGSAVVPLLGGHHGANDLARDLGEMLNVNAAITTSGDVHFGVALDEPPAGLVLSNPQHAKSFMAKVLAGEKIRLEGECTWLVETKLPLSQDGSLTIKVTTDANEGDETTLVYHPRTLSVGLGCERGTNTEEVISLLEDTLAENNLAKAAIGGLYSIDLKADETALHQAATHLGVPVRFFDVETLTKEEPRLANPSDVVKAEVGVAGVAEAAALAAAGEDGTLIVPKQKSQRATIAIAKASQSRASNTYGRARGRVSLIGIGPGTSDWRSPEATKLLSEATDWVGYDLYLDLVAELKSHQQEHRFPLGAEEKRVRHALELAATGKDVAVVCSGDAGIYAMATLAYELIDTGAAEGEVSDAARRVELVVSPGISAFQAAAAKAGAPIGHDFCCISLSDLLTPREAILQRLEGAALGDFVVAFYNPRSRRRVTLLDEAFDILRKYRPADTPVILATDLGRPAENVRTFTLETVNSEDVDMLTLVMVGSSASKAMTTGDGKTWVYTPRGYDRKGN